MLKEQFAELVNGERIAYLESGVKHKNEKPTVLLIHCNFGSKYWWLDVISHLEPQQLHIVSVDLRGFGNSSYFTPCQSLQDWALDMVQLSELLKIKSCISVGWSFGGAVALKMAEIAQGLVQKLSLTCSVSSQGMVFEHNGEECKTKQQVIECPHIKSLLDMIESQDKAAFGAFLDKYLFTVAHDYPHHKRLEMVQQSCKERCYVDTMVASANSDINLASITAEGLVIHGVLDTVIPIEKVSNEMKQFNNSIVRQNNAHMIPIQDPKWLADTISSFVYQ